MQIVTADMPIFVTSISWQYEILILDKTNVNFIPMYADKL